MYHFQTSVGQLAEYSWSNFGYSPLIIRGSSGIAQLVTLRLLSTHHPWFSWQRTVVAVRLLSTHHPWISWQSTAGLTSITPHSSSMDQLVEHSGRTSITLYSSPVDQLPENSWSHFCCSPLITRGSAGIAQWSHFGYSPTITRGSMAEYSWSHFCYSPLITRGSAGRVVMVTLRLLSTHHPWIVWHDTAGHTAVTLHS